MSFRYGSVCSGIEAASVAFEPLAWQPAFFSEVADFPSAVLAHRYGSNMPGEPLAKNGVPNHGDFTQIPASAGPIDLLVGGTPCQSFSVAGKRLGLDDPRGNLALEYLRLAVRLRARWILWENVPGVVSSVTDDSEGDGGVRSSLEGRKAGDEWIEESDFATFLEFVRQCGYGFAYRILDAQYVRVDGYAGAVPQRRRRVFVVGYLDGGLISAFGGGNTAGPIEVSTALTALTGRGTPIVPVAPTLRAGGNITGGDRPYGTDVDTCESLVPVAFNPQAGGEQGGLGYDPESGIAGALQAYQTPAVAFDLRGRESGARFEGPHETANIRAADGGSSRSYMAERWAVRRMTPTECERLQGFPDGWTDVPHRGRRAADGPRYKALGNSIAVNVIRWIGIRIAMVEEIAGEAAE